MIGDSGFVNAAAIKASFETDFFVQEIDFTAAGANAAIHNTTVNGFFTVQANSAFLWERSAWYATVANAAFNVGNQPLPSIAVTIQDQGSGRILMTAGVPLFSIFGNGQLPFVLPTPRIFMPSSTVSLTVQNFDAAVDYNLRLSFIGTKIFNYGPNNAPNFR